MTDVVKATEAALTPATFDFAKAVLDRDYPEIKVPVYLNERKAQRLVDVTVRLLELDQRVTSKTHKASKEDADKLSALQEEHDQLADELKAEEYTILIRGISPEESLELEDVAYAKFEREYDETVHPLSGQTVKTEKENDKRDEFYATLIRQAHIVSVTAPNGAIDTDFKGEDNLEKVRVTWARLPFLARVKVDNAINDSKVSVDYYRELADEVFSQRP